MNTKFKPGDIVYATSNDMWGMDPMKVLSQSGRYVRVEHKAWGTTGCFDVRCLELATKLGKEHAVKLKELKEAERKVAQMKRSLFGKS